MDIFFVRFSDRTGFACTLLDCTVFFPCSNLGVVNHSIGNFRRFYRPSLRAAKEGLRSLLKTKSSKFILGPERHGTRANHAVPMMPTARMLWQNIKIVGR